MIRSAFLIFCFALSPLLIVNSISHKRRVKKKPFGKSIVVRICNRYPFGYQIYNFIMNFPLGNNVYSILPKLSGRVLQVGCGTGALNKYLKSHHKLREAELFNLDTNINSIHYGVRTGAYQDFIHADICDVPVEDEKFDMIVFARCFHHLRAPKKAFKECERLLKKGGVIIISDVVSLSKADPDKSFMMNSNFDGLIWRYNKTAFKGFIAKTIPATLQIKSVDYIRQRNITNYNTFFPNTDGLAIIEKV